MSDRHDWMDHLTYLPDVALSDLEVLAAKEATYQGSWKRAGGRSAWFMFRRNMDRLISMMAPPKSPEAESFSPLDMQEIVHQSEQEGREEITLSAPVAAYLYKCWESEDLFRKIEGDSSGADGTVLACLRDLRRYAMLVEAEMIAQGVVEAEGPSDGGKAAQALVVGDHAWAFMRADYDGVEAAAVYGEVAGNHAGSAERHLGLVALSDLLRALQPNWSEEIIERSAHHAAAVCPGADVYTQIASLTGEDRQVVKARAYEVMYGGPLAKPQDATLGDRIAKAVRHAVNYHGLDARLDAPDHVIADLITPEVVRHLERRTDAQLVEAGWILGPDGKPVPPVHKPGTSEDGGHHARFVDGGVVPGANIGTMLFGEKASNGAEALAGLSPRSLAVKNAVARTRGHDLTGSQISGISAGDLTASRDQARRRGVGNNPPVLSGIKLRTWSFDFSRMRQDVLAYITDPVSDVVCLTMQMHHSQEEITVRLFLRGGQLSFETVGSGIQASGEANELILGRLFEAWCVDDLPEPRGNTQEQMDQLTSLEEILDEEDRAREAANARAESDDPPGMQDDDPMYVSYEEKGK